jgi:hypothetical protein
LSNTYTQQNLGGQRRKVCEQAKRQWLWSNGFGIYLL